MIKLVNLLEEDLRDWFGKGGKGGVGGGGWDRYNSSGDRIGKCGDAKEGDAYSACLSKEKARKLGKSGRAAFVKRKRAAQKKGGDAKKGGERSKGQKPIKVTTEEQQLNERMKILIKNVVSKMVHGAFGPITNAKMREEMKDAVKAAIEPILKKYDYVVESKQIKLKEIVQEIGDAGAKVYPYSKVKDTGWVIEYGFTTDLGTEYIVRFEYFEEMADVSFFTKESLDLARRGKILTVFLSSTNKGEMFSVMATVTQIVKEFLDENETITILEISPSKESDEDNRRFKLYMAYINKQLDPSKFEVDSTSSENNITITRKNTTSENLDPNTFKDTGKSAPYGSGYQELEERLNLFLEKNIPTDPGKWSYYKGQAKKKFDVYPSAYANAWAAKKYKAAGGGWRKSK